MRRILRALALLVTIVPAAALAQNGTGIGIIVGEPTGLSLKSWVSESRALDAGLAWSFVGDGAVDLHGDYLLHNFGVFDVDRGSLPVYYGIGMRAFLANEDARLGLRVPIGIEYLFSGSGADLFFELAPLLDLTPATDFKLNGAVGIRYFFR